MFRQKKGQHVWFRSQFKTAKFQEKNSPKLSQLIKLKDEIEELQLEKNKLFELCLNLKSDPIVENKSEINNSAEHSTSPTIRKSNPKKKEVDKTKPKEEEHR